MTRLRNSMHWLQKDYTWIEDLKSGRRLSESTTSSSFYVWTQRCKTKAMLPVTLLTRRRPFPVLLHSTPHSRAHQPSYSYSHQNAKIAPRSLHRRQTPSHQASHAGPPVSPNAPLLSLRPISTFSIHPSTRNDIASTKYPESVAVLMCCSLKSIAHVPLITSRAAARASISARVLVCGTSVGKSSLVMCVLV